MNIYAMPDLDEEPVPPIPAFQGKPVSASKARVTGAPTIELDGETFEIDGVVRVSVEARVVAVTHEVDDRTGDMNRVHKLKVIDVLQCDAIAMPSEWSGQ